MGRVFTEEFRKQAVELAASLNSTSEAARQLGISDSNIHNWRTRGMGKGRFSEPSLSGNETEELKRLRKENAELKKVNHILKAAAAFFSQDHLK